MGYWHQADMGDAVPYIRASLRTLQELEAAGLPIDEPATIIAAWESAQKGAGNATKWPKYQEFMRVYMEWFQGRAGVKPHITPAAGKNLNILIGHLASQSKSKDEDGAMAAFQFILTHWERLSPFIQKQVSLPQIVKNIDEILTQLRNGNTKQERSAATTSAVRAGIRGRRAGK